MAPSPSTRLAGKMSKARAKQAKLSRPVPRATPPIADEDATGRRLYSIMLERQPPEDDYVGRQGSMETVGGFSVDRGGGGSASASAIARQRRTLQPIDDNTPSVGESGGIVATGFGSVLSPGLSGGGSGIAGVGTSCNNSVAASCAGVDFDRERENPITLAPSRRRRTRSCAASDSGASCATLAAAGANLAASHRAPSMISAESLVVNTGQGVERFSVSERMRLYLANDIPELKSHVDRYVAAKGEKVRQHVDDEVVHNFMRQTNRKKIFSEKENCLRWQGQRRATIQRSLDAEMPRWMWEAVQTWTPPAKVSSREAEVSDADLIFDYLSKRAAHIDADKLPTEIPVFKPLAASYSSPSMLLER
eukprot:TRINITY_DN20148_c0_g2_i1.p1 TRINITY_DN20148_c0_g2~~TRINITY_DN20148_c0_g2_i1.p1  ORF type:complete len:364 (+),score=59.21 TRINITY_DN20148_c0_g2_i1:277-1368(+)